MINYFIHEAAACVAITRYNQAFTLLSKAFLFDTAHPESFLPLTTICQLSQRHDELEHFCQLRLVALPEDCEALYHLASVALHRQHFSTAKKLLTRLLALNPRHLNALIDLGCTVKKYGDIERTIDCFRQALIVEPASSTVQDNYLFSLLFSDNYSREELFAAHRNWGATLQTKADTAAPPRSAEREN